MYCWDMTNAATKTVYRVLDSLTFHEKQALGAALNALPEFVQCVTAGSFRAARSFQGELDTWLRGRIE